MTTIVSYGDRLITPGGKPSWLKRGSVPFGLFGFQATMLDGRTISFQELYEQQPWVYTVVNKINRQLVRLPLRVMKDLGGGEAEPVYEHPLCELLERPWKRGSCTGLKQKLAFPTLLHGNGLMAMRKPSAGAPPESLVPLDWRYINPIVVEGELVAWATSEFGPVTYFAPEEVIHMAWEGGRGDIGVSPLVALGVTLRNEDSAQRYQQSSFSNGARPSGGLVTPPDVELSEDEKADLRAAIHAMHGGVDQSAKIALLTGGVDWKPMAHTAVEAELIEQRKLNREEVAAAYDMDPPLIGILDHATYSNVGEMHRMLYGPTLGPWLALTTDTLNAQLIGSFKPWQEEGLFVEFDLTEVLKANTGEEMTAVANAFRNAVMTPNEGRRRFGLPKSKEPDADALFIPANNLRKLGEPPPVTGGAPGTPPPGGPPAAEPPGEGEPSGTAEPPPPKSASEEIASALTPALSRWVRVYRTKSGTAGGFPRDRLLEELKQDVPALASEAEAIMDQFIADMEAD